MKFNKSKHIHILTIIVLFSLFTSSFLLEPEKCNPECDSGVCYQSKCYCEDGYIGNDCSIEIKLEGFRVGLSFFILILISAFVLGIAFAYILFSICSCCCNEDIHKPDFSKSGINLMETWERKV